jgi:hypothetical protein
MYQSKIGDDGVLGPAFTEVLSGLIRLLNGELGTQDGGKLDRMLRNLARQSNIDANDL